MGNNQEINKKEDEILLHGEMPGIVKDDISINIDNGTLSLSNVSKLVSKRIKKSRAYITGLLELC